MNTKCVDISVVVPVYRCGECLPELHRRLALTLDALGISFELILVNDGCPAGSGQVMTQLASEDQRVKALHLSRNFGQQCAIAAGVHHTSAEWVVVMDGDLQDRPEEIPHLYFKALEGYDIVYALRMAREDSFSKKAASRLFSKLYNVFSEVKLDHRAANFSVASRKVIDSYCRLQEHNRSYHLLLRWMGYKTAYVEVEHAARYAGKSAYNLKRSIAFAVDSITSHSNKPLEMAIRGGFVMSILALTVMAGLVFRYFAWGIPIAGWTSVICSVYFIGGLLFAQLGIMGIYLGKVFGEARERPLYLVRETQNIDTAIVRHTDQAAVHAH